MRYRKGLLLLLIIIFGLHNINLLSAKSPPIQNRSQVLIHEGWELLQNGDYDAALIKLFEAKDFTQDRQELSDIYFYLSQIYFANGSIDRSRDYLRRLFEIHPERNISEVFFTEEYIEIFNQFKLRYARILSFKVSTSPPGAKVLIDGILQGTTPLEIDSELRRFRLRIEHDSYETIDENISLTQLYTEKTYSLKRNEFKIDINTSPSSAKVYIDDTHHGDTPCVLTLRGGQYQLRIEKEGYLPIEKDLNVFADQKNSYNLQSQEYGYVSISFDPYAEIEIDGRKYGEVPPIQTIKLPVGKYLVKFIAPKLNKEKIVEIEIVKDMTIRVHERFD